MRLVFTDSEVAEVQVDGDLLRVRFSAASIEPTAAAEEAGYLLGAVLELRQARWEGDPAACFGRVVQGSLGGSARLALPCELQAVECELQFQHGARLNVRAASAQLPLGRGERFRASYAC